LNNRIPPDDGNAKPATSLGGTGAAANVEVGDVGGGPDAEGDEYDSLLTALGRSYDQDCRIAIHESGHIVAARLLGHVLGGATVNPGPGYEGRVWGKSHEEAYAEGRGDASDVLEAIAPAMPGPGEDINSVADVFANVYSHCIELAAGRVAERMLLGSDDSLSAADDLRQARELAVLFCRSEDAIQSFVDHCGIAARDLLMPYGDVVIALSVVLRIKRTMNGAEIDELISDVQTRKARAVELARRADWKRRELSARAFQAEVISRY
jgi:hypothetical protein